MDVLIGNSATASAEFAFTGLAGAAPKMLFGNDVELYLSAANTLSLGSNDNLTVPGGTITGGNAEAILIGSSNDVISLTIGGSTEYTFNATTADFGVNTITNVGTNITGAGALTIGSTGANTLTLDSGNNILTLAANDTTISGAGLTTITAANLATITSSATLGISATTLNLGGDAAATISTIAMITLPCRNGTGTLILDPYNRGITLTTTNTSASAGY
jgi:hypothetical protein